MITDEALNWISLSNSTGIGPKTFWSLLKKYGNASEALKYVKIPFPKKAVEKTLKSIDYNVILANDEKFPVELKRSSSCPPVLFYKGDINILSKRKIAIIGARNASIGGMKIAKVLAEKLSADFAIVSGLAKGIDACAHLGSLIKQENKSAVAVLPFCLENIYPKENSRIYKEIAEHGLLISEVFPRTHPDQGMFQARNRLVSLLSEGMIVIEAGVKSGTMSTAKLALDFGCEVMVVPGSPLDPRYFGSNILIKNGAPLIQDYFDVMEILKKEIGPEAAFETIKSKISEENLDKKAKKVLSVLSSVPISLDLVAKETNLEISELLRIISNLEISGKIVKLYTNEITLS